jgi:hypothetical protein
MLTALLNLLFGPKVRQKSNQELLNILASRSALMRVPVLKEVEQRAKRGQIGGEALLSHYLKGALVDSELMPIVIGAGPDYFSAMLRSASRMKEDEVGKYEELFGWFITETETPELTQTLSRAIPESIEALFRDGRPRLRELAAEIVSNVASVLDGSASERVARALLEAYVSGPEESRDDILFALHDIAPRASEFLLRECKRRFESETSGSWALCLEVLVALADEEVSGAEEFLQRQVLPQLIRKLESGNDGEIHAAASQLRTIAEYADGCDRSLLTAIDTANDRSLPALLAAAFEIFDEDSPHQAHLSNAFSRLQKIGEAASGQTRVEIADCIGTSGRRIQEALPLLDKYLRDGDSEFRLECVSALAMSPSQAARRRLEELQDDRDPEVAEDAKFWVEHRRN